MVFAGFKSNILYMYVFALTDLSMSVGSSAASMVQPSHQTIDNGQHVMPNSMDLEKTDPHVKHDKGGITLEQLIDEVGLQ